MKKNKDDQAVTGVFAFWRYDQYPYVLGGVIDRINDKGLVRVPSYGNGWVTPIKMMSVKAGEALLDALKGNPHGLEAQRRAALEEFEAHWDETLFTLFGEARHPNIPRHWKLKKP